LIFFRVPLT